VRSDVNRAIWRIFRAHGVTIPVPQYEARILRSHPPRALPGPLTQGSPGLDQAAD
jgi:small-conductance mechanosensitive channel